MDLLEFLEKFPGENECLEYFIATRLKAGITCLVCGSTSHKWVPGPNQFECNDCCNRINIKTGTLMEKSQLPIKQWFVAIALLTSSPERYSINEILEKFGDADSSQISLMLVSLKRIAPTNLSFDQLLYDCVNSNQES